MYNNYGYDQVIEYKYYSPTKEELEYQEKLYLELLNEKYKASLGHIKGELNYNEIKYKIYNKKENKKENIIYKIFNSLKKYFVFHKYK